MEKIRQSTTERHTRLIALLKAHGYCSVLEVSRILGVSAMTIRRDLHALQEKRIVEVTYGGARFIASEQSEAHFNVRTHEHAGAKQAIGRRAAETFIEEGDVIGIDSGSTTLEVARALPDIPLTVVTNSLPVATIVARNHKHQLIVLGGMLQSTSNYFYGRQAIAELHTLYFNKLFLASSGLLIPEGLSSSYLSDAEMKQAMIKSARKVVLCMDSSKIGCVFLAHFAALSVIDALVTDDAIGQESRKAIEEQDIQVLTTSIAEHESDRAMV